MFFVVHFFVVKKSFHFMISFLCALCHKNTCRGVKFNAPTLKSWYNFFVQFGDMVIPAPVRNKLRSILFNLSSAFSAVKKFLFYDFFLCGLCVFVVKILSNLCANAF